MKEAEIVAIGIMVGAILTTGFFLLVSSLIEYGKNLEKKGVNKK